MIEEQRLFNQSRPDRLNFVLASITHDSRRLAIRMTTVNAREMLKRLLHNDNDFVFHLAKPRFTISEAQTGWCIRGKSFKLEDLLVLAINGFNRMCCLLKPERRKEKSRQDQWIRTRLDEPAVCDLACYQGPRT